jgi:disulfide bond formation protein DsbB
MTTSRAVHLSRWINVLALVALLGVLAGSLHLQFGVGEQPCPLCLVQRSGMIGLSVGPIMNLLWGIRARHYALSILAALVGSAGSIRQILLHIYTPGDPGYGPAVLGWHLYTWALVTFIVGIAGCAILLLWQAPLVAGDHGVFGERPLLRVCAFTAIAWVFFDLLIIAVSIIPECGLGMCPDDPANTHGIPDPAGWWVVMAPGLLALALAVGVVANWRLPHRPRSK